MRHVLLLVFALLVSGFAAWAQQPTLPGAPVPTTPPDSLATADGDIRLGHRYEVSLLSGVSFTGALVATSGSSATLVFEAGGLGQLSVDRKNIRQLTDLSVATQYRHDRRKADYFDIGGGSRYFFGPSGRNLRRGEGVVQSVGLFLTGVNYGVTDYLSLGGYLSLVPGLGLDQQFIMLTPKLGVAVAPNWHVGAGALYVRVPNWDTGSVGAGLLYGVATHGSADDNLSLGLGYGFANRGVGSTPTLYLAGQKRVSSRLSLVSENYLIAARNPVVFGIYGVKVSWPRVSLGLAAGYYGYSGDYDSGFYSTYVYPVYIDVSFRFGKPYAAR